MHNVSTFETRDWGWLKETRWKLRQIGKATIVGIVLFIGGLLIAVAAWFVYWYPTQPSTANSLSESFIQSIQTAGISLRIVGFASMFLGLAICILELYRRANHSTS